LLAFQLVRSGASEVSELRFMALVEATPTATAHVPVASGPTPVPTRPPAALPVPQPAICTLADPRFQGGIASLKLRLGAAMGDATDCEHVVDPNGNTQQRTTTGLAYYRKGLNIACFTTGWDHWALVARGVVHWTGDSVDPPPDATLLP
jgi:hypothetical protein